MKKVFSFLAVLALLVMASSAWAEDTLPDPQTAYAEFTAGELNITVDLYSLPEEYSENFYQNVNSGSVSRIEFAFDSNFKLGSSAIYRSTATVFAKIKTNLTAMSGSKNLYMYTNNMNNSDGYKVDSEKNRRTETYGKFCDGLIRKNGKATEPGGTATSDYCDQGDYAPIKMYFIKAIDADAEGKQFSKTNYPDVYNQDEWSQKGLKNLHDINDVKPDATSFKPETLIGKSGTTGGVYCGQGDGNTWYAKDSDVIIFFGAEFRNVVGGDTYSTNTIQFQYATE